MKGYEYPRVHHAKRKGHDGVVIGLFLGTLLVSMGAGFGALFLVSRKKQPPPLPPQPPVPAR